MTVADHKYNQKPIFFNQKYQIFAASIFFNVKTWYFSLFWGSNKTNNDVLWGSNKNVKVIFHCFWGWKDHTV